jgi:DNA-binding LytR/AlgR family response regulator
MNHACLAADGCDEAIALIVSCGAEPGLTEPLGHAVRAFEVNALDYLLKPIEPRGLAAAMSRVTRETRPDESSTLLEQMFVKDGDQCWFIPLREVRLLASEGNYVRLSWKGLEPLVYRALVAIEQRLNRKYFFRANRSQIINLDFIKSVETGAGRMRLNDPMSLADAEYGRGDQRTLETCFATFRRTRNVYKNP